MGLFGSKSKYSIDSFFPEENAKLQRIYSTDVFPKLDRMNFDITNRDDMQKMSKAVVQALEKATDKEPYEFIWNLVLGDHYYRLGKLSDAVRASQRAVNIKPDDPRAHYALATTYRMLMRAIYAEPQYKERAELVKDMYAQSGLGAMVPEFDPNIAVMELNKLHMTWQDAARESVKHFYKALEIGFKGSGNKMVEQTISEIRNQCMAHGLSV